MFEGVFMNISGKWNLREVESYLKARVIPLRLSVITSSGYPLVVSMWYLYEDRTIWCAAQEDSVLVRNILKNGNCGFEVAPNEPPYMGVRGRGDAEIVKENGVEKLRKLIEKYLDKKNSSLAEWLLSRSSNEVAIKIRPECLYSWDYSGRMK